MVTAEACALLFPAEVLMLNISVCIRSSIVAKYLAPREKLSYAACRSRGFI
jgi:hypothetical protein